MVLKNRKKFTEIWGNQFDINYDYFFSLIWKVVKSSYEKDSFDESKFIKEYEKLKDFFHNENTAQVQILVPLHNLESNFGNIDVSDLIESTGRLVLRPITDEDKTFLISVIGGYESERTISIHSSDFMLELEYYDKFYSEGEYFHEKIKAQVAELITALRLLKKGYVGASLILVRHPILDKTINVIHLDYDLFSILPVKVNQGRISYNRPYILKKDEIGELQTILHLLKEITDKNKGLAIRRFNSAYEKSNKADKFLDLMIACEALFSDTNDKDSLTHKIAWRFSRLLGKNTEERRDKFSKMKELYSLRSKLVHGNKDEVPDEMLERAEDYMRKSLNDYLREMNNSSFTKKEQFLDCLDFIKTSV